MTGQERLSFYENTRHFFFQNEKFMHRRISSMQKIEILIRKKKIYWAKKLENTLNNSEKTLTQCKRYKEKKMLQL